MSAQFVLRPQDFDTRLCQAHACPNEADGFWGLCTLHSKQQDAGTRIQIHTNPPPGTPTLWCSACKQDLPDEAFSLKTSAGGRPTNRRNRHWICRPCDNKRRARERARA